MSIYGNLTRISEALDYLRGFTRNLRENVQDGRLPQFEQLLDAYVHTQRTVADQFEELSRDTLMPGHSLLEDTRLATERRMKELFSGNVPDQYLKAPRYGGVHPLLLEYLARHVGQPVPASRLRILAGDQVHTERRVRALRDFGFKVSWKQIAGEAQYILESETPDLNAAAAFQIRSNLKRDRALLGKERDRLLAHVDRVSL